MSDLISTPSRFADSAVEVYYGGQRLYPSPLIDWRRVINRGDSNEALSQQDTYILRGIYLKTDEPGYENVVDGMETLKGIFANDNQELTIYAGSQANTVPSGTILVSGVYPYVDTISIPDRNDQFQRFDYEVTLVAASPASGVSGLVSSSSNSWQFSEEAEGVITRVTHTVNAVGITSGTTSAIQNAKSYVDANLGTSSIPSGFPSYAFPGDVDGDTSTIYEYQRSRTESVDEVAGSYEVTEIFVYVSGTEPYSHNRVYSWDKDSEGIINVSIQGTVQGYPRSDGTDNTGAAFANAQSGYLNNVFPDIPTDAQSIYSSYGGSGTLNIGKTQAYSISENRYLGTITYNIQYTDDPGENLPSGIIEHSITIQRDESVALKQSHVIPQRRLGALFQDIGTSTLGTITVNANAKSENTGDEDADVNRALSHIQDLINQNRPNPSDFIRLEIASQNQSHNPKELSATASVVYNYTVDLATVPSANADIVLRPV